MTEDVTENTLSTETDTTTEQTSEAAPEASPAATNVELTNLLSEEYKESSNLKDFKSVDDLAKSYINLQGMVGNSIRVPAEDASPEAKQEFLNKIKDVDGVLLRNDENLYDKLGRPENPDAYKFEETIKTELYDQVPGLSDELASFKETAHKLGLSKEQAQALVDMRLKGVESHIEQWGEHRNNSEQALKQQWGTEFDNRLNAAKQMATVYKEKYGDSMDELINGPAGNNPALLNILSELGESYKEKGHEGMQKATFGMTPEGAQAKIHEKRSDIGFMEAYNDQFHPGHKKAVGELQRLYAIANGQRVE